MIDWFRWRAFNSLSLYAIQFLRFMGALSSGIYVWNVVCLAVLPSWRFPFCQVQNCLTIILCSGPKHKMIVKFWYQVLTRTCTKILKKVGERGKYDFFTSTIHSVALSHWGLYHEFSVLWHNSFMSVLQHDINVGHDVGWEFTMFSLSNLWWNQSDNKFFSSLIKYQSIYLDTSFYIFGYLLEPWKYESGLKFWFNYGYWKFQKSHYLSTFDLYIAFWLHAAIKKGFTLVLFYWGKTSPFFNKETGFLLIFFFPSVNLTHFVIKFFLIEIGWRDPSYGLGQ